MNNKKHSILFLCEGNSARSIFAEYLTKALASQGFDAYSAGSNPRGEVHPMTLKVLGEVHQIDASDARSKSMDEYEGRDFDFVVTVCDHSRRNCPNWTGEPVVLHWGSADPLAAEGSEEQIYKVFRDVSYEIRRRVELFAALPLDKLDRFRVEMLGKEIGEETAGAVTAA